MCIRIAFKNADSDVQAWSGDESPPLPQAPGWCCCCWATRFWRLGRAHTWRASHPQHVAAPVPLPAPLSVLCPSAGLGWISLAFLHLFLHGIACVKVWSTGGGSTETYCSDILSWCLSIPAHTQDHTQLGEQSAAPNAHLPPATWVLIFLSLLLQPRIQ